MRIRYSKSIFYLAPLVKMHFANIALAFKLFDLQLLPKVLYAAHIWGIGCLDTIERIHAGAPTTDCWVCSQIGT